ncbi:MAG TPA: hypothetical protein VI756_01080 [Blastocatellia bacterium]
MPDYVCRLCLDTGVIQEADPLSINQIPSTFCRCLKGQSKWREVTKTAKLADAYDLTRVRQRSTTV